MDYWMILYILICVVVGGFAASTLWQRQQNIGAALSLVLLVLIFVFYGLRWFQGGTLKGTQSKTGNWPPIVNFCPDYMTAVKDQNDPRITLCYDSGNIYNMKQNDFPYSSLTTIGGQTNQRGFRILNNNITNNIPSISLDSTTNPKYPLLKRMSNSSELSQILNDTNGKWLKWEGVWDGQQLSVGSAPLPK